MKQYVRHVPLSAELLASGPLLVALLDAELGGVFTAVTVGGFRAVGPVRLEVSREHVAWIAHERKPIWRRPLLRWTRPVEHWNWLLRISTEVDR